MPWTLTCGKKGDSMQNTTTLLNAGPDCSIPFHTPANTFFHLDHITDFHPDRQAGRFLWRRHGLKTRMSFNQMSLPFEPTGAWEFPDEYGQDKMLDFDLSFIGNHVLRLRISGRGPLPPKTAKSEMIFPVRETKWTEIRHKHGICYESRAGRIQLNYEPLELELQDSTGKYITRLVLAHNQQGLVNDKPVPTSIVRRAGDLRRMLSISLTMEPGEHIAGCGESFTRIDKRGQKLHMWSCDPKGVMGPEMYKPVPFYISSRGYGLFCHSSAPSTFDFGTTYDGAINLFLDDDMADLFFFLGTPKQILDAYTGLTGKSPVPPLWSFGLWMSRCTYREQTEVLHVAELLRSYKIPCDVIHIDTGWFETNWRCDFRFSPSRFPQAQLMLEQLRNMHFHVSLWMMPYFNPNNKFYPLLLENHFAVTDADGKLPTEDAVLDFSNPDAVRWFCGILKQLFAMGVSAMKTDFGEAAPLHGLYASGASGKTEHNLYPLRYQKTVFEATKDALGEGLIWARAGWAGSQRYPLHWGGDSESTNGGLAASLRGGISLGASGYTYWSHDIGGFCKTCPEELYLRWLAFGAFSSHARCHGQVPKEPWTMQPASMEMFRSIVEVRYRLLPYIYTQSVLASRQGLPLLRGLFLDYPEDPVCWVTDDVYLFGSELLVAPLLTEDHTRHVYLPAGRWVDYQTNEIYEGGRTWTLTAAPLPIIVLVRYGAAIPHARLAQSTAELDWKTVTFQKYPDYAPATGILYTPDGHVQYYKGE